MFESLANEEHIQVITNELTATRSQLQRVSAENVQLRSIMRQNAEDENQVCYEHFNFLQNK
jgi:hypothetical protein